MRAEGQIKVIVELQLSQTPADRDSRESAIADAQDQLLVQLKPLRVQVNTGFELYPLLTLTANEATLRYLFESPLVERVHENKSHKAQS